MSSLDQDGRSTEKLTAALTDFELRQRDLFDALPNPVFIFEKTGYRFLYCNEGACRLYGYTRQEFRGMTPVDLHPPEDLAALERNLDAKNTRRPNTYTHLTKEKSRIAVQILTNEIMYGGRLAWISVVHDISERARIEKELKEAHEHAEEANRLKGEFLANMSHEIRTPMNAIIGMTELALETQLDPEQKDYLEIVRQSSTALLGLLNDVLDLSKVEAGKLDMEAIEFQLRDAVRESLRTISVRAERKGLVLACDISEDVPDNLIGDPGRLRQVLINLVGNAIKFTERGEVVVRVTLKSSSIGIALLRFAVQDTGIGIPAEKQRLIFEAFTQADGSMTRTHGGTGLGLSISAQLVSMMGGTIGVESRLGKGSTFSFTVRLEMGSNQECPDQPPPHLADLKTLLVDGLAVNQRIVQRILKQWRMATTTVDHADAGLRALRQARSEGRPFDLVILDTQLPDKSGFEMAREIRSDPELDGLKIVTLTSAARRGDGARCREIGVDAYLTKPVIQSDLLEAIRAAVSLPASDARSNLITAHSLRESRSCLKVLLAEDNLVNQKLAGQLLIKRGHSLEIVGDGKQAVEAWRKNRFDIILMDVQMPEMDGLEATALIRASEKGSRIPIIAMTASAMRGDREECLRAGMDDYLAKPIKPTQLFETIENAVQEHSDSFDSEETAS